MEDHHDPSSRPDHTIPIPTEFHSLYGPFNNCLVCDQELVESNRVYTVERIFRDEEPIVEFAICMACQMQLGEGMSRESTQRIEAHLEERIVWEDRLDLINQQADDVDLWIGHCILSKQPSKDCRERQIIATCRGDQLELGPLPLMLSGVAVEEMQKLLSKKTRDTMGDFIDSNFGLPSEFCDSPTTPLFF